VTRISVRTVYTPIVTASSQSSRLEYGSTIMNADLVAYFKREPGNCLAKLNLGKVSQCFDRGYNGDHTECEADKSPLLTRSVK
jgi:hypothetical protein